MRSVTALSTAFLMIVSSMAGCIEGLEDIADAIGCSDENASNYDPDATSGSDDLCLFLENEARFMAAMGDAMAADPSSYLLDSDSGVSGVEYSMSMSGSDPDSGMSVSIEMLSVIMVDLESQSMYNRSMISYMDMISIDSEMVWSGTDIMVTTSIGGPMASEVGESGTTSSISRDMSPDLEEVVRAASFGMTGMMGMEDLLMAGMLPDGDDHDDHERDDDEDCASNDEECGDGEDREEDDDESDFDWFDRNQDGFVEMGEIETVLYEEPSFSSEMADCIIDNVSPIFSDADENDDQKLDEYEFDGFDSWLEINFDIDEACGDNELPMDDMMPEGSSVSITQDDSGIQTMVMQTVDDTGDMTMWIRLHGDGSFHSYEMEMDDGESVMSMTFSYLTSEMVSIPEIDYTLDRTATPISVHVEPMMVCDDGELVPAWSVMDGWEDCEDGSDESLMPGALPGGDDDDDDHGDNGHGYEGEGTWIRDSRDTGRDVACTENIVPTDVTACTQWRSNYGHGEIVYFEVLADYEDKQEESSVWVVSDQGDDEEGEYLVSGDWYVKEGSGAIMWREDITPNDDWWSEEDANIYWKSYYDGYCGWEGNPDGDDTVWWCKISQADGDWDNWWYYCEYHEGEDGYDAWHCTDDLGQSEDYEHSAGESLWSESDENDDDDEVCIWEDEHGVVHYDCEDSWEDYDFPMVMHAHVVDQVANAPITDFELRMLDCDEGDMDSEDDMEDDSEPIWDECTVVMAFPLSGGEIDGVLVDYVDSDGDGMVSSGDISIVSGPVGEYAIQPYDTWAEEYSADSALIGQELPGFGAFLGVIGLLGAALAGRERDA